MVKLQTEKKHEIAKSFLDELSNREKDLTKSIYTKYGRCNIEPETGEITKLD